MDGMTTYLSAADAAEVLGIQTASLYAYVSRGLIRSEPAPGKTRARRYLAEDVYRLQRRQDARRNPDITAEPQLAWGGPVLDSAITLIEDGRLFYRGHDATGLAGNEPIEAVAGLLWHSEIGFSPERQPASEIITPRNVDILPTAIATLQQLTLMDPNAYDLREETLIRQGTTALQHIASLVAGSATGGRTIAAHVQQGWLPERPETQRLIDAALVLCADHELNASSFAVRVVASTRAPLYAALTGGLAALSGTLHGAASLAVEALVGEIDRLGDPAAALAQRLRRGEQLPGFGHRLYRDGDPRARRILELMDEVAPGSEPVELGGQVSAAAYELSGHQPNLEFALVMLARLLGQPTGTALSIMALGRTVGWVAHALEEYQRGELIRPRARYTGPPPIDREAHADLK